MQSVAEEDVVRLLLIDQPFRLDLAPRLDILAHKTRFFGILSEDGEMTFGTLLRRGSAAERSVGPNEVTLFAGHALVLDMLGVAESDGLLFGFLHEVGQNPPSQNKGHDQTYDKRAPAAAACFACRLRCGCVVPLLHLDASCC